MPLRIGLMNKQMNLYQLSMGPVPLIGLVSVRVRVHFIFRYTVIEFIILDGCHLYC